jgi:hypothetical protein
MKYARSLAAGLGLTLACAFAGSANALEQGECKPFAEMITALKAEGQKDLIQADKWTKGSNARPLYMITSNDNGDGYELVGDRFNFNPRTGEFDGSPLPKNLCVGAELKNVRLNNAFSETVPDAFLTPGTLTKEQVKEISARENVGGATDHNTALQVYGPQSERKIFPVLQASIVLDGGKEGPRLTVLMDTNKNEIGSANRSWENGFMVGTDVLSNVGYSETALKLLEQGGPQVAALTPN